MLKYQIAMLPAKIASFFNVTLFLAAWVFFITGAPVPVAAQAAQETSVRIDSPLPGEALQGVVQVTGNSAAEGFRSAEIAFAYQSDPTDTWFLIQQSSDPVQGGSLASWDTTTITDGTYKLRVRVFIQDGQVREGVVEGLRVRNYSPVETATPVLTPENKSAGQAAPLATATTREDFQVISRGLTPQPTNPAQVTPRDLQWSALRGTLVVLGLFALAGLYLRLRVSARS